MFRVTAVLASAIEADSQALPYTSWPREAVVMPPRSCIKVKHSLFDCCASERSSEPAREHECLTRNGHLHVNHKRHEKGGK